MSAFNSTSNIREVMKTSDPMLFKVGDARRVGRGLVLVGVNPDLGIESTAAFKVFNGRVVRIRKSNGTDVRATILDADARESIGGSYNLFILTDLDGHTADELAELMGADVFVLPDPG